MAVKGKLDELKRTCGSGNSAEITISLKELQGKLPNLSAQPPMTLLRLRATEIGLPMLLCLLTFWLLKFYPLTEERAYEIKALLNARKQSQNPNDGP